MNRKTFDLSQMRTIILAILVVGATLFPFYWMAITSFKPLQELYNTANNPLYVKDPIIKHYVDLFTNTLFANWMSNSLIVSIFATGISISAATLAGYALGRLKFPGANFLGWAIFVTYLIPQTLLFLPLVQTASQINRSGILKLINGMLGTEIKLINSLFGLILIYPTFLIPFSTWLLIGFFRSIPIDLEECAMIDGARRITAFWRITLPLALPGVLSVAIFSFTLSWNEFLYALVFISSPQIKTIPIGVTSELIRGDAFFWGQLMAGALLGSVPVALIYSFFVDQFVSGMTAGAVKG
ncbi:MAG: carbohydrate ABC transporter permease [Chloroflexota bacterium]